ncbi:exonuclease domain-containing protein [Polluticoccus soli]|uniref:exonuclease domain-containing protein n=1 Tax=Polluticoccus soli TaxID=3034150 RepID=UPI0023E214A6|nr:exonuclease domain-containing protein [Flavipsychrobacter sp. JY13-12]
MLYAIVDIETTGSFASGNGITEIAIAIHDGEQVINFYETLVNPHQAIPYFIQSLTGITNEMVANAPSFEEVAGQIHELLQDKVFVAHNVNFDYSFVKHHLQEAGYKLEEKKLCTVRLSRKILPGKKSYSLGKLCRELGIGLDNHHRAGGDTMATANLFTMLVANDAAGVIPQMLKGRNREQYLPPHLPVEQLDNLPRGAGVYYFYNEVGKPIYVGKANNIFKRVKSHFSNNKSGKQKQDFLREIHRISYKECATELMAHILESTEIRRLWPRYNRSQRGYLPQFGLFVYEDRSGFKRFAIEKNKHYYKPLYTFNTLIEGHNWLRELIGEFDLCPRLCNLAKVADCGNGEVASNTKWDCEIHNNPTSYNKRADDAITWIGKHLPSFAFIDKGIDESEQSCILVKKGNFYGMGYIQNSLQLDDIELLQEKLEPYQDNDYIRNLILKHAAAFPEKCYTFG